LGERNYPKEMRVAATLTQAKASKRRLKPATTNYKKKKLLLTLPKIEGGGK